MDGSFCINVFLWRNDGRIQDNVNDGDQRGMAGCQIARIIVFCINRELTKHKLTTAPVSGFELFFPRIAVCRTTKTGTRLNTLSGIVS